MVNQQLKILVELSELDLEHSKVMHSVLVVLLYSDKVVLHQVADYLVVKMQEWEVAINHQECLEVINPTLVNLLNNHPFSVKPKAVRVLVP